MFEISCKPPREEAYSGVRLHPPSCRPPAPSLHLWTPTGLHKSLPNSSSSLKTKGVKTWVTFLSRTDKTKPRTKISHQQKQVTLSHPLLLLGFPVILACWGRICCTFPLRPFLQLRGNYSTVCTAADGKVQEGIKNQLLKKTQERGPEI